MLTLREGDLVRRAAQRRIGRNKGAPTAFVSMSDAPLPRKRRRRKGVPKKSLKASPPSNEAGKLHAKRMKKLATQEDGQGMEPIDSFVAMGLSNDDTYVPSDIPRGYKPWTALPDPVRSELMGNMKSIRQAISDRTIRPPKGASKRISPGVRNRTQRPCLTKYLNAQAHAHGPIPAPEEEEEEEGEERMPNSHLDRDQHLELSKLSLYEDFDPLCRTLVEGRVGSWWAQRTCSEIAAIFTQRLGVEVHQYVLVCGVYMYVSWNLDVDKGRFYGCLVLALSDADDDDPSIQGDEEGRDAIDAVCVWNTKKMSGLPIRMFYYPCICQRDTT